MTTLDRGIGANIDRNVAFSQTGRWTLARVGATNRAHGTDHVQFDPTLDDRTARGAIVQLNGRDLYDIEVGHLHGADWVSELVLRDIDAEALACAIEDVFQKS